MKVWYGTVNLRDLPFPWHFSLLAALSAAHKYYPLSRKLATSTMVLSIMLLGQNKTFVFSGSDSSAIVLVSYSRLNPSR